MLKFKDYTDYKQKTFINDNDNSTKIRLPFSFLWKKKKTWTDGSKTQEYFLKLKNKNIKGCTSNRPI